MLLVVLYYRFLIQKKKNQAESRVYKSKYLRKKKLQNVQNMKKCSFPMWSLDANNSAPASWT